MSIRTRPSGWPVMYQTWDKLLFLHWPIATELLRPLIAPRLSDSIRVIFYGEPIQLASAEFNSIVIQFNFTD